MNETLLIVLLVFLLLVIPLIQHFRFKAKYAGFKDIQTAIQQETNKLASLKHEMEAKLAQTKDHEERVLAAIKMKDEAQSVLEKTQIMIAGFEESARKARAEVIEVKNELVASKVDLAAQQGLHKDQAAAVSQLTKETLNKSTKL